MSNKYDIEQTFDILGGLLRHLYEIYDGLERVRGYLQETKSFAHHRNWCRIKSDLGCRHAAWSDMHFRTYTSYRIAIAVHLRRMLTFFLWVIAHLNMHVRRTPSQNESERLYRCIGHFLYPLRIWACWGSMVWNVDVFIGWGIKGGSRGTGIASTGAKRAMSC
jgi:hypothetical protein